MALQPLSIGDILMMSQQAWKIGRAFTKGKKSAPSEFAEVEREANGLSDALRLVADTLHADGSILSHAEPETVAAVDAILESARKTLDDLESFVARYQVIKKRDTSSGFVVERTWTEAVMANYKTFKWTTEGGDITELRNMLQVHTNTINLTMQALQSRSLARLEKTVMPMADHVANIHDRVNGDLGDKIDDLHRIIMAVANSTPSLNAKDRAITDVNGTRHDSGSTVAALTSTSHIRDANGTANGMRLLEAPPPLSPLFNQPVRQYDRRESQQSSHSPKMTIPATQAGRGDSAYYSMGPLPFERDDGRADWGFESGSPPEPRGSLTTDIASSNEFLYMDTNGSRRGSAVARRESATLPSLFSPINEDDTEAGSSPIEYYSSVSPTDGSPVRAPRHASSVRSSHTDLLPPPAIPPETPEGHPAPATPSTYFSSPSRALSDAKAGANPRTAKPTRLNKAESSKSPVLRSASDAHVFEKALFRNSAILCDVRGTLVEYAWHNADETDHRYDTEMKEMCTDSRIYVIRKRENREHGGTKIVTSIWALSDDGKVRCQQKLSEVNETVPYCSYFDPLKVSLPATDGAISLRCHGTVWGESLIDEKKTKWVNYVFADETDATSFQAAVFGRALLGSYRTTKTTVIHEGFKGVLAFEEQFANIEMLRFFEEDGISTPGAAGGVLALMHISSNFGDGWARWWMNSSLQQVRVKDDGPRHAKVKGIDITVVRPGTGPAAAAAVGEKARSPAPAPATDAPLYRTETNLNAAARPQGGKRIVVKKVTGVRIEFKTEDEKALFVSTSKRVQGRMIPLPDL